MTGAPPDFDADTALAQTGPASFEGRVEPHWFVERGPNGGFVAALVLRALTSVVADGARPPRSLTVHYLATPQPGPITVETILERQGRSMAFASARVYQGDRIVALALCAFGVAREAEGYADARMPPVPGPEDFKRIDPGRRDLPPFMVNWDMRPVIGAPPFAGADRAEVGGWLRPPTPRPFDHVLLGAMADAWYPALFSRVSAPHGAPTVDLTLHFRAPPEAAGEPGDFVLGVFRSSTSRGGYWEEDGELWSRSGELLVQSRQLALSLPAAPPARG